GRLKKIVTAALWQADPEQAQAAAEAAAKTRGVFVAQSDPDDDHGTKRIFIRAATGAVIRFDATVDELAQALKALGDTDTLDERRAKAIDWLADPAAADRLLQLARHLARTTRTNQGETSTHGQDAPSAAEILKPPEQPEPHEQPEPRAPRHSHTAADQIPTAADHDDRDYRDDCQAPATDATNPADDLDSEPGTYETHPDNATFATAGYYTAGYYTAGYYTGGYYTGDADAEYDINNTGNVDDEPATDGTRDVDGRPNTDDADYAGDAGDAYGMDHDNEKQAERAARVDGPAGAGGAVDAAGAEGKEFTRRALADTLKARLAAIKRDAHSNGPGAGAGTGRRNRHTLYVHLTDNTLATGTGVLRTEDLGPLLASQLSELLGHDQVIVKPVIDLHDQVSVDCYEIPDRIRERVRLRHPVDMFPYGGRESTASMDLDHITPYKHARTPDHTSQNHTGQDPSNQTDTSPDPSNDLDGAGRSDCVARSGSPAPDSRRGLSPDARPPGRTTAPAPPGRAGQTSVDNLIPQGRLHHRAKTFGGWRNRRLPGGGIEWISPHGFTFLVDHTGTHPLSLGLPAASPLGDPVDRDATD
ncbi:hypothetical protein ACFV9C_27990, partial [Kribbella sp. NPDC059898]